MSLFFRVLKLPGVALFLLAAGLAAQSQTLRSGVPVNYQLPTTGPLPQTYRVTLAIVDAKNANWIVSQFACGAARTVTVENQGKFTEVWNGLDDNFMPAPPGNYGVKGIYMHSRKWPVDGDYHTITPQFVTGASAWMPSAAQDNKPEPFGGDPVGSPLRAVAVGPNGVAVFYYQYLENGLNNPMIDLKKPVGYAQFQKAFGSGGVGGGSCTATDGETVWSYSVGGGPVFVYRADQKPFGEGSANRNHVYRPEGWVTAMAAWRGARVPKSFVYVAERGEIIGKRPREFVESDQEFVDKIVVLDGENGKTLRELPLPRPQGLAVSGATLYALHTTSAGAFAVSSINIGAGVPQGSWQRVFDVPKRIHPFDLAVDSHGLIYVSDPGANHVFQLNRQGEVRRTLGRLERQTPGAYDPLTLMSPQKLTVWTDASGNDRLLIVEQEGPNRVSEWSSDGKLLREFLSLQTSANDGYAIDPEYADRFYIAGHGGWLTRFRVDYARNTWTVDAVWPDVGNDPKAPGFDHPKFIRIQGREYLACARSYNVYRRAGDRWLLSAAIIRERRNGQSHYFLWSDTNGDGQIQEVEYRPNPIALPGRVLRYHGEQWLDDLSMVAVNEGGRDLWRLAPNGFDAYGNPVFKEWRKLLTDPIFEARAKGSADSVHGANELDDKYSNAWAMADGAVEEGFYVNARGGPDFSANAGAQVKISHYVPDGQGGYRLLWRTGREALQGLAEPGEIYGSIHLHRPINGLLSVMDQTRCGVLLYTEAGLYVDTLFPDSRRLGSQGAGIYPQPGEFFAGDVFADHASGQIYIALGKDTPLLFKAEGWSLSENPVRPLENLQKTVRLSASQIAAPPEIALSLRGGAGTARVARFMPALGGAALDGSLRGWESCEPVTFQADKDQKVEVRCLYDTDHLYLRWQAHLATKFMPKPLRPIERIFTHDRLADTLSFYIQGDLNAKPGGPQEGRPGDARFVFGVFQDGDAVKPVVLGLYPVWPSSDKFNAQTYATPVGKATFERVGPVAGAQLKYLLEEDGKGFVLVAVLPRAALPQLSSFGAGLRTMVNFEATFSGHNKFWWANSDGSASRETYDEPTEARLYPGSWAPAQFQGLEDGVVIRHWLICGPWGGPGAETFPNDLYGPEKNRAMKLFDAAVYPPDSGKVEPESIFKGELLRGYWRDPGEIRWKNATTAALDTRVTLGPAAQVWYGATWVYAPVDTEVEFRFQGHPQTFLRFFLNGQLVQDGEIKGEKGVLPPVSRKMLTLRRGWNQVLFRGYCVGYPPFRAGLVLAGDQKKLWTLKFSAMPPAER